MDTRDWWKNLNHNWKKVLLVNLDFDTLFPNQYPFVCNEVAQYGMYNAYHKHFKKRIRKRLDYFKATDAELERIISLKHFVVSYMGIKDLQPISRLVNLEFLTVTGTETTDLSELAPMQNLKYLCVACPKLIKLNTGLHFPELTEIKFTYCYQLDNIEALSNFARIQTIDLSYLGKPIDVSSLKGLNTWKKLLIYQNQLPDAAGRDDNDVRTNNYNSFFNSQHYTLAQVEHAQYSIIRN